MLQLILVLHVLVAISIIVLVLLQHGRGADVGASFGSGASNTMFGSAGSLPFLMKVTAICAAIFFGTSILLSYLGTHQVNKASIINMQTAVPAKTTQQPGTQVNPATTDQSGFSFAPTVRTQETPKQQAPKK